MGEKKSEVQDVSSGERKRNANKIALMFVSRIMQWGVWCMGRKTVKIEACLWLSVTRCREGQEWKFVGGLMGMTSWFVLWIILSIEIAENSSNAVGPPTKNRPSSHFILNKPQSLPKSLQSQTLYGVTQSLGTATLTHRRVTQTHPTFINSLTHSDHYAHKQKTRFFGSINSKVIPNGIEHCRKLNQQRKNFLSISRNLDIEISNLGAFFLSIFLFDFTFWLVCIWVLIGGFFTFDLDFYGRPAITGNGKSDQVSICAISRRSRAV
jgi:hypothetical protein